jgi:hypothetical protein
VRFARRRFNALLGVPAPARDHNSSSSNADSGASSDLEKTLLDFDKPLPHLRKQRLEIGIGTRHEPQDDPDQPRLPVVGRKIRRFSGASVMHVPFYDA